MTQRKEAVTLPICWTWHSCTWQFQHWSQL